MLNFCTLGMRKTFYSQGHQYAAFGPFHGCLRHKRSIHKIHLISMLVMLWTWLVTPILDEEGCKCNIFDEVGYCIPQRKAIIDESVNMTGMLTSDDGNPTWLYIYPMALLCNMGNFKLMGWPLVLTHCKKGLIAISPIMAFTPLFKVELHKATMPILIECNPGPVSWCSKRDDDCSIWRDS